ncbi:sensor histidine kinase [Actinomadura sp. ATCC 31491]|uniref:histidine kinase n=1 Tax=Actinomadura luzonensis TaxID=2805427 RepID=A0ABT0G587_9ACTN|nr:sensor histidine kinase [Actinomadura luzonensis]MCK2219784.1 sensor histidine kinase [Actinomadura luzonensis]
MDETIDRVSRADKHPFFARRLSHGQLIMLDLAAGFVLAFVFFTSAAAATQLPPWARISLPLALGLPLALRRLWPMPVFLFTLVLAVVGQVLGAVAFPYLAPAYALYVVALGNRAGSVVPVSAIGTLSLLTLAGLVVAGTPQQSVPSWVLNLDEPLMAIAALGGAWTIGRAVYERRLYAARNAERLAAQAVTRERFRIARELHDVVTHNVGLIAVKAGVANHVITTRPEEAQDALRVIETASRSALVEMRHLLGMLRSTSEAPDRAPAPGLAGLESLARQARSAGVEVQLETRLRGGSPGPWNVGDGSDGATVACGAEGGSGGDRGVAGSAAVGRLPEGVELAVYRIVQEALTNVIKHASPARCRVSVVGDGKDVRVEVVDDGPGRRTLPSPGVGHGLIGMRERVMMYGGVFEAESLPGRGFRVFARLPYEEVT